MCLNAKQSKEGEVMGRAPKYNWRKLFLEYNQGGYKSARQFAAAKKLNYDQLKKEFRKLQNGDESGGKNSPENRGEKGQKKGVKKAPSEARGQNSKRNWPEEKLQAYLLQLDIRKKELEARPLEDLTRDEIRELQKIRAERRMILSDPDPERVCVARRHDGQPCKNHAERGKNVCWYHGGAQGSGPPEGSQNALKHGAYETIWLDQLEDEERALVEQIAQDKVKALEEEIMLLTVRERRMLARIAKLTGLDYTVVKQKHEKGVGPQGYVDKTDQESHATLGQIQLIEEHLTKVQEKKLRAIELKHKIETGKTPDTDPDVQAYVDALTQAAEEVWVDEDGVEEK